MNKVIVFTAIVFLFVASSCGNKSKSTNTANAETTVANVEKYTFNVEGMTCTGCEETIEINVKNLEGIQSIEASHTAKTAMVEFDPQKSDTTKIKNAIAESGYQVIGISQTIE